MADLLLEKRKIVIVGKNRQRKRIPEARDSWVETVSKMADAGGWKEQRSGPAMMLPGKWLEDTPRLGVRTQPTPSYTDRDSTCMRGKVRPPSIEE